MSTQRFRARLKYMREHMSVASSRILLILHDPSLLCMAKLPSEIFVFFTIYGLAWSTTCGSVSLHEVRVSQSNNCFILCLRAQTYLVVIMSYNLPVKPVISIARIWVRIITTEIKASICILKRNTHIQLTLHETIIPYTVHVLSICYELWLPSYPNIIGALSDYLEKVTGNDRRFRIRMGA